MKEYLENRLKDLKSEYSILLTKIGENKTLIVEQSEKSDNYEEWKQISDKKSRIDELKLTIAYFKENNYENL